MSQIGPLVLTLENLLPVIAFSWKFLSFHGSPKNNQLSHVLLRKFNIVSWLLLVNCNGWSILWSYGHCTLNNSLDEIPYSIKPKCYEEGIFSLYLHTFPLHLHINCEKLILTFLNNPKWSLISHFKIISVAPRTLIPHFGFQP